MSQLKKSHLETSVKQFFLMFGFWGFVNLNVAAVVDSDSRQPFNQNFLSRQPSSQNLFGAVGIVEQAEQPICHFTLIAPHFGLIPSACLNSGWKSLTFKSVLPNQTTTVLSAKKVGSLNKFAQLSLIEFKQKNKSPVKFIQDPAFQNDLLNTPQKALVSFKWAKASKRYSLYIDSSGSIIDGKAGMKPISSYEVRHDFDTTFLSSGAPILRTNPKNPSRFFLVGVVGFDKNQSNNPMLSCSHRELNCFNSAIKGSFVYQNLGNFKEEKTSTRAVASEHVFNAYEAPAKNKFPKGIRPEDCITPNKNTASKRDPSSLPQKASPVAKPNDYKISHAPRPLIYKSPLAPNRKVNALPQGMKKLGPMRSGGDDLHPESIEYEKYQTCNPWNDRC